MLYANSVKAQKSTIYTPLAKVLIFNIKNVEKNILIQDFT